MDIEIVSQSERLEYRALLTPRGTRFGAVVDESDVYLQYESARLNGELRVAAADLPELKAFIDDLYAAEDTRRDRVFVQTVDEDAQVVATDVVEVPESGNGPAITAPATVEARVIANDPEPENPESSDDVAPPSEPESTPTE